MTALNLASTRKRDAAPLSPELVALTESEVTERIAELEAKRQQMTVELTEGAAAVHKAQHEFDQASAAVKEASRREATAIEHVTHERSPKATHELGIVQRELERAREAETVCRNALYDAISAQRAIQASLAEVEPKLDALPRAIEAKRLDARITELAPVALAQHEALCRTLIEMAGLDLEAQALGLPPVNPRWFDGAGNRVQMAVGGGYQALPEVATQVRLDEDS